MNDDQLIRGLHGLDQPMAPEPVFADALFARLLVERGARQTLRVRGLLVAAALLLLALVVTFLVAGRQADPGPLQPLRWSRADPADGAHLSDVTAFGAGFVAVGGRYDRDGLWAGSVIQHSADGVPFHAIPLGDQAPGEPAVQPLHAVYRADDGSVIAVGYGSRGAVGWRSTDGETWEPRTILAPAPTPLVAASPGRYLLISDVHGGESSPGLWHSTDGLAWKGARFPAIPTESANRWNPVGVAVGDGGYLVVVCRIDPPVEGIVDVWGNDCRSAASMDAATWTVSEPLPARMAVAWYRGAWLGAYLAPDRASIQVLRSTNGVTWSPFSSITDHIGPRFAPGGRSGSDGVDRLVAAGDRLLLSTGTAYARAFSSPDGVRWQDIGLNDTVVTGLATNGERTVSVGREISTGEGQLWLEEE